MFTQSQYDIIRNAYFFKKFDNDTTKVLIKEDIPEELRTILLDIQRESGLSFDLSYTIANECTNYLPIDINELEDYDIYEEYDIAPIYFAERLAILTPDNQYDISEIFKECSCDSIEQACEIYYERAVQSMFDEFKALILETSPDTF